MKRLKPILCWFVAIAIPFLVLMTSIRILINPWYLNYQYNKPNFPPDVYGFTKDDRLKWGNISLEYLINNASPSFLGDLRLDDGTPLYNPRELSHMVDVKEVVQGMLIAWYILGGLFLSTSLFFWGSNWKSDLINALIRGGWLTLGLIAAILIFLMINFDALFTTFHALFFEGDTWRFAYSDTLIRLFPLPLWEEAFIWTGVFAILIALILVVGGKWITKSKRIAP